MGAARTGDLDVVPALIDALVVPNQDEEVITSIRLGLQILSRKIKGMGPPSPSSPEERLAAARQWRDWYQAIRPLDLEGQDEDVSPARAGRGSSGGEFRELHPDDLAPWRRQRPARAMLHVPRSSPGCSVSRSTTR